METGKAGRELALVFCLAITGLALVLVVAFTPWYEPVVLALGR